MIELRPSPLATVSPGAPALLQTGYYIHFSDEWPNTFDQLTYIDATGKSRGKYFQIAETNQVNYDLSYKIPSGDFRDVDFGNTLSNFNENLYPTNYRTLYEIQLGWKPANLLAYFMIPAGDHLSRLEQAQMIPPSALPFSATLRYLGAKKPEDSPYTDKRIYVYTVRDLEPLIMRLYVDSGQGVAPNAYDKVVTGLLINKCYMKLLQNPLESVKSKAKEISYYSEIRWL